jgi:hypothetical protein
MAARRNRPQPISSTKRARHRPGPEVETLHTAELEPVKVDFTIGQDAIVIRRVSTIISNFGLAVDDERAAVHRRARGRQPQRHSAASNLERKRRRRD